MESRKTLLLISTRQFWPITNGKSYTLFSNCKLLSEKYNYDISLICFSDKNTNKSLQTPDFIKDVKYVDVPEFKRAVRTVFFKSIIQQSMPIQASLMFDVSIQELILNYAKSISPDVIMVDMIRLLPYMDVLKYLDAKKILLEDDLLEKRYERQMTQNGEENLAGEYFVNMTSITNKFVNCRLIRNIILKTEIRLLKAYERHGFEICDYICFTSPVETYEYNHLFPGNKGRTLVVVTDTEKELIEVDKKPNSMCCVSDFRTTANATSIKWISQEIMPLFPENVTLYAIGKYLEELNGKIDKNRIHMMGYVDDLNATVRSSEIYFAPVAFGSGIKTKIVEAMGLGMPVVTNSVGAEGLDVTNGKEIMIADTPLDLVNCATTLLCDDSLRAEMGNRALEFVKTHHSRLVLCEAFNQMGF